MGGPVVGIDARRIMDRESFHDVFSEAFGFPEFYGRTMDAWVDCLSDLGLTQIDVAQGDVVILQIDHVDEFAERCPGLYDTLVECAAFVNWRRIERGMGPVLALSFSRKPRRL